MSNRTQSEKLREQREFKRIMARKEEKLIRHFLGSRIPEFVNEKNILHQILQRLQTASGASLGILLMLEEDRQQFNFHDAIGLSLSHSALKNLAWSLQRHRKKTERSPDQAFWLSQQALAERSDLDLEKSLGFKSLYYQPLGRDGQVLGAVLLGNREEHIDFLATDIQQVVSCALVVGADLERIWLYRELQSMALSMIRALVTTLETKDIFTCGHSERVADYVVRTAQLLGWQEEKIETLHLSALLHDIGKIGVPEAILLKPARLTSEEYAVIKCHPENGVRIISKVSQLTPTLAGILFHHERFDGQGYPHGLRGEEIPPAGRLIAVADAYDAMTGERPYRKGMAHEAAIAELHKQCETQFDPAMVDAFLAAIQQGRFLVAR